MTEPLSREQVYRAVDPDGFGFATTADIEPLEDGLGQSRAKEAIEFGTAVAHEGYNLFAFGAPGTGRHTLILAQLEAQAKAQPAPDDWCYVNNFADAKKPEALRLPSGTARGFAGDMEKFVEDLRLAIPSSFDSDDYRERRQSIEAEIQERQEEAFKGLHDEATAKGAALVRTPMGFAIAPVSGGKVIEPAAFQALPENKQEEIRNTVGELEKKLEDIVRRIPGWRKEMAEKLHELNRDVTAFAATHLIDALKQKYALRREIVDWLDKVREDIIDNAEVFWRAAAEMEGPQNPLDFVEPPYERYRVNVFVDNHGRTHAPVIRSEHPTFAKLFGRVDHESRFGALLTDYRMIRPGALHEANGGFLVIDIRDLLMQPLAWEHLKRVLRSRCLAIESLGEAMGYAGLTTLDPEPIPLDIKIVLVGDRMLYHLLSAYDPDVQRLFKVAVDFEDSFERSPDSEKSYARFIAGLVRRNDVRPMEAAGVARLVEFASRRIEDAERLSLDIAILRDLILEADHWASVQKRKTISQAHVQKAIDKRRERLDRLYRRSIEGIVRNIFLVETSGKAVGQINGLSVISLGEISFGKPSRITANVRLGRGEVVDIERQVELGGPLHSKGVMILTGFLGEKFGQNRPLALSASLVFEQSYGGVDGDSASAAELIALLSALADVPIAQGLAITGSVNQKGRIQAIGGVNEKIEGFFDICKQRGLRGRQGVLIPASNVQHLMLRDDIVAAVGNGKFSIYPIERIEDAIELLMATPAGVADRAGTYPAESVYRRVCDRLDGFAETAHRLAESVKGSEK